MWSYKIRRLQPPLKKKGQHRSGECDSSQRSTQNGLGLRLRRVMCSGETVRKETRGMRRGSLEPWMNYPFPLPLSPLLTLCWADDSLPNGEGTQGGRIVSRQDRPQQHYCSLCSCAEQPSVKEWGASRVKDVITTPAAARITLEVFSRFADICSWNAALTTSQQESTIKKCILFLKACTGASLPFESSVTFTCLAACSQGEQKKVCSQS